MKSIGKIHHRRHFPAACTGRQQHAHQSGSTTGGCADHFAQTATRQPSVEQIIQNPESFGDVALAAGLQIQRTDYITVDGQYIMNEERTFPLFEIMNLPSLIELVMSTEIGKTGGPVKSSEGEIIFRVIEEKEFDQSEFEMAHDYIVQTYTNLKGNFLFNDWYISALRNSKIVDNFNSFFKESS